jgi:hypothetical protein
MTNTPLESPTRTALAAPASWAPYTRQVDQSCFPAAPTPRPVAAVIADLLRPRVQPTRSREEQAFIDLQRGGPA